MERSGLDLSRQGLASLEQVPRDVVRRVERAAEPYALSLAQNRLTQLNDLFVFAHVVQLDLSGNQLQTLGGIETLPQLESLNAARNSLTSIDALASLSQLRVLNIAENRLAQIDALRSLKSLVAVDVSYNRIASWPQLSHSTKLESIDLSNNLLEAFPVGTAVRLFPSSLRRLSLAKNEIQELCGIAALGMYLPNVETIKVESNPATQRVIRDGGCLEFLWVNLFANVTFAKGGAGVCRDDFVAPRGVVDAVEDAVERGDEAVLTHFLLTGTASTPAAYSRPQLVAPPSRIVPDNDRHHDFMRAESPVTPATTTSDELSKESKMAMWKRIQDERRAQELRDKAISSVREVGSTPPPPPPAPVPVPKPLVVSSAPEPKTRAAQIPSPSKSTSKILPRPREPSVSAPSQSIDALVTQVKILTDQLTGMRKYVNVWIKREQLTREAAAKRIQRCHRRRRWLRHVGELVQRRRQWRRHEYGVMPCSSTHLGAVTLLPAQERQLHLFAVMIQRHVRGWLMRDRVSRWMYYSDAAVKVQRMWRQHRGAWVAVKRELGLIGQSSSSVALVHAVAILARDVRQLQRVFVVQERVMASQWRELAHYKRLMKAARMPAVVKVQSLWRGYAVRRQRGLFTPSPPHGYSVGKEKSSSRDAEIVALRVELEAIKEVVQRLLVDKN